MEKGENMTTEKIIKVLTGSRSYGLAIDTPQYNSDYDYRGVFVIPKEKQITILDLPDEITESEGDTKFYELKKFFKLAVECNPNLIEILFSPLDCIVDIDKRGQHLLNNKNLFISKKAKHTFSGYAFAQIKKAKGENKWINNKKSEEKPKREDFCYFIDVLNAGHLLEEYETGHDFDDMPFRPYKCHLDLSQYHVSAVEHSRDIFRVYKPENPKGVFRDGQLVCEPIPKNAEWAEFVGVLLYNEDAFEKEYKDWKSYWDWVKNRNESRWSKQESGELDYDVKNMMHCIRLLWSGINIMKNGEPIVRVTGKDREFLMDIRNGKFTHDYLMLLADEKMRELDEIYQGSPIPHSVDMKAINELYYELTNMSGV
jgi:predicted nucleotidyltransferase